MDFTLALCIMFAMAQWCGTLLSALLLCALCSASAQSSDWGHVKQLPPDQGIRVEGRSGIQTCDFVSANDDELVCQRTRTVYFFPITNQLVMGKADVRSIRLSRRGLSALAGAAVGAGAGAGIGAGVNASSKNPGEDGSLLAVLFGTLGGTLGGIVGYNTDFLRGAVVYRAP